MADIATDRRADGRRQRRHQADDRLDDTALGRRKNRKGRSIDRGDHAAADKALNSAIDDHLHDISGRGRKRAGNMKPAAAQEKSTRVETIRARMPDRGS